MIEYYLFIKANPTVNEEIVTQVEPKETATKLEFLEKYLTEEYEFQLLDTDPDQELFELCSGETYTGYPRNTLKNLAEVSHLIDTGIVCRVYGDEEFITIRVFEMNRSIENIEKYTGVNGARGYDVIDSVESDLDIELEWDWDYIETTLPTAMNI